jgi:hemerythrin-like metal-binding protein
VDTHFRDEETAMQATNYAGLAGHRAVHEAMRKQVGGLLAQFQANRSVLTSDVVQFLMDWLINHMEGEDQFMAAYLKQCDLRHLDLDAALA